MGTFFLFFFFTINSFLSLLVLHPCHKLRYFENAGWEEEWIKKVEEILQTEFDLSYRSLDTSRAFQQTHFAKDKVHTPYFLCKK